MQFIKYNIVIKMIIFELIDGIFAHLGLFFEKSAGAQLGL
jgi:hypothetical protein